MIGKMRTMMAYIDTPILIGDMGNKVVYVNPACVKTMGKKAPEIVGKEVFSLFSVENKDRISAALTESKKGVHQRIDIEEREMFFRTTLSPVTADDGRVIGFVMGLMDLSREKRLEQSRMDITARLLGDLHAPLENLSEALDTIKSTSGCTKQCRETLERALEEIHIATGLVNDLLGLSGPSAGTAGMKKEEFDPARALRAALKSVEPILEKSGVAIESILPRELPPVVGDRDKMSQVLMNLMMWSARMMSEKRRTSAGMNVNAVMTVSGKPIRHRDGREYVLVTVIAPEYRINGIENALEVVSARQIIEAHSGTFIVAGDEDMGTTFSILLPVSARHQ